MAEVNDEVIDDVTDVTEDDDTTDDSYEPTLDDYQKEKARREKAEKTLVDQKRKIKELESKSSDSSDIFTKADYAMEKFLDKNPELSDYTKELSEYTKKGLSLDDAKTLVMNSDKAKQNREKTNSLGIGDGEPVSTSKSSYTKAEIEQLSDLQYDKVMSQVKSGKVKLK